MSLTIYHLELNRWGIAPIETTSYVNTIANDISNMRISRISSDDISWIRADGDELEYIRQRFQNIPICPGSCTWSGEWAKFIYDNL